MDDVRFHDLLDRYHDGEATAGEMAELESHLQSDAAARRIFVERNLMEIQLRKSYGGGLVQAAAANRRVFRRRRPSAPNRPVWAVGAVAATILFAIVVLFASTSRSPESPKTDIVRPVPEGPTVEQAVERAREGRRQAEENLARVEQDRLKAETERRQAEREEARRAAEAALARADVERREARERLERAREEERRVERDVAPTKVESPLPETRTAVATVESLEGEASTVEGDRARPLAAGTPILSGQGVRTRGETSRIRLTLADGTSTVLEGDTEVTAILDKRISVERGTVRAHIVKQPRGRPLIFATPQAEAMVLGTTLALTVEGESTRLEVREGRVQLKRLKDSRTVDVGAGQFARTPDLVARPLPVTEVLLLPSQATVSGSEWRPVKGDASGAVLLEAAATANRPAVVLPIDADRVNAWFAKGRSRSWLTFTFAADANRDYWVWVLGRCAAPPGSDRQLSDSLMVELATGSFAKPPPDWRPFAENLCAFDGFGNADGFWWSGGFHDPGNTQTPIVLRFKTSGIQVVRIHALETPIQFGGLWLSTTKSSRPAPEERPGKP